MSCGRALTTAARIYAPTDNIKVRSAAQGIFHGTAQLCAVWQRCSLLTAEDGAQSPEVDKYFMMHRFSSFLTAFQGHSFQNAVRLSAWLLADVPFVIQCCGTRVRQMS